MFLQHPIKGGLLCLIKVFLSEEIKESVRIAKRVSPIRELSCKDRKGRSAGWNSIKNPIALVDSL